MSSLIQWAHKLIRWKSGKTHNLCQAESQLQCKRKGRTIQNSWMEELAWEKALQDLPKGEHTTHTLGWLGQDWSCSGTALYTFLSPTEAVAWAFLLPSWLLRPLHLHHPSTSVPTLVKATIPLMPLARALPNFLFQTMIIHMFSMGLHPFVTFWSCLSQFLLCVTLTVPIRISPLIFPPPQSTHQTKTQFWLSDSLLHGNNILELTGTTGLPDHPNHLPAFPVSFSFSSLQLICSY